MDERIPAGPEDVTDAWLTAALGKTGTLDGARIAGHTAELLEQQGAAGVVARLGLAYDRNAPAAPRTLVAKFASPYAPIRALLHHLGGYAREVEFYRRFGADPGIPVPQCFYADIDRDSGMFVLLLEDMSDARVAEGMQLSVEDVESAVRHLAEFHARWWEDERLHKLEFLRYPGGAADQLFMAQARVALGLAIPQAAERYGEALPPTLLALAERLLGDFDVLLESRSGVTHDAVTLVHGDFHPGQLFFPSDGAGRFAVFDWQTVSAGSGGDDLARIIVTSLDPQQREACDGRLIALYHALLVEHGVKGYDIERCHESFRQGLVTTAMINIIASVNIDPALIEEYSATSDVTMTDAMFGWVAAAIESHGILDLVSV